MKRILSVIVICCLVSVAGATNLTLDDGGIHTVNSTYVDVLVLDEPGTSNSTTANILLGADISQLIYAQHSIGTIYDGSIYELIVGDNSRVAINSGSIDTLLVAGNGRVTIDGGRVNNDITVDTYAELDIYGGLIAHLIILEADDPVLRVHGTNFSINGVSTGYGVYANFNGSLMGTLSSGETINTVINNEYRGTLILIPEPGTMVMLGMGGLVFRRKRRGK